MRQQVTGQIFRGIDVVENTHVADEDQRRVTVGPPGRPIPFAIHAVGHDEQAIIRAAAQQLLPLGLRDEPRLVKAAHDLALVSPGARQFPTIDHSPLSIAIGQRTFDFAGDRVGQIENTVETLMSVNKLGHTE